MARGKKNDVESGALGPAVTPRKSKSKSLDEIAQKLLAPPESAAPVAAPEKRDEPAAPPAAAGPAPKRKAASKPKPPPKPKAPPKPKPKPKAKPKPPPTRPPLGHAEGKLKKRGEDDQAEGGFEHITVRRMHRRDIKRVWDFLKRSFRDVNRETVEYQRPRSKQRFEESYDDEGIEQLLFEVGGEIVGYAECAFEVTGSDNWINPKYFESRDMRPLFVEELATSPDYQGRGVGSFMLEQLQHLARIHGCTHLVLEVAENNEDALTFYKRRNFVKLDAALFMAMTIDREPDLLPPRALKTRQTQPPSDDDGDSEN